ncbi:MAG TPA: nitronate monooxygenase [Parvibaculum sp.]
MSFSQDLRSRLDLPLIAAPMFLVSGPELVMAECRSGVIGSFPCSNARTPDILEEWVGTIADGQANERRAGRHMAPWSANFVVHATNPRLEAELSILENIRAPIVITALGGPQKIVERVHAWGGKVIADVNSVAFAKKAVQAGVDGLILVTAGSGGHTGRMNNFAFVAAVRDFYDGMIAVGGGMSRGSEIRACEVAGADLAIMGTAFIATHESLAEDDYKQMLIESTIDDLVLTNAVTKVFANWLRPTLIRAGIDPELILANPKIDFSEDEETQKAKWKTVWSAGHGLGRISAIESVSEIVERLKAEYIRACELPGLYGSFRPGVAGASAG